MSMFFNCPHCENIIEVNQGEINCGIFRHGYYIENNRLTSQMNPHENMETCMRLVNEKKIVGCGKPFKIIKSESEYKIEICDYI